MRGDREAVVSRLADGGRAAAAMNLELPGLKLAHRLYALLKNGGGAKFGTQALIRQLEKMNA